MCGLAAAIDWEGAEGAVRVLADGVLHRGTITDPIVSPWPNTAVCTRRLPIVDEAHGRQPMLSPDGRILLSFNGEIYNHRDLRSELEAQGCVFRTESDTEVLACALSLWGAAALPRLVGMYAFVALDLRTQGFLAARDPLGVKPLYLIQDGPGVLFCSEIAPLLAASETGEVMLLPPGHLLTRTACHAFPSVFSLPVPACGSSPEALDRLLADAVTARVPQEPCALMFSGGIDSTLVAHYARRLQPDAPGYFLGDETAPDYAFAARYADLTGMDLRMVDLPGDDDPGSWIDRVVRTVESFEPGAVRGGLCNSVLSRQIRADGYRVALSGDGADELFAGYRVNELTYAASPQIGEVVRNQCLAMMSRDNLQLLDRCSMRFQVEAREPFLDPGVVRYALGCDSTTLLDRVDGRLRGKAPLRRLYNLYPETLPVEIRDRCKAPFNEGSGFDRSVRNAPWIDYAETQIGDAELREGIAEFRDYEITTKEELLYLRRLKDMLDIARVPHLKGRAFLRIPRFAGDGRLAEVNLRA